MWIGFVVHIAEIVPRGRGVAFVTAHLVVAGVGDNAEQPGAERSAAELRQRLVSRNKSLLRRVVRCGCVAQQMERQVVYLRLIMQDERVESLQIASLGALD